MKLKAAVIVLSDYPVRPPLFTLAVSNNGSYIRNDYIRVCIFVLVVHRQKRASRNKSAITKPIYDGLMISLLQVVNILAASCELHAGLMQVVSSTCSKSANIKLQQV